MKIKSIKKYKVFKGKKVYGNEYHYKYDDHGNRIYEKHPNGTEYFWEYNED